MKKYGFLLLQDLERDARRVFTTDDAMVRLNLSRKVVREIISRLKRNKQIISLTSGLYALWHPSEHKYGLHPMPIIDSLMKYRKSSYYIGLLSAADYWGAAHHKPQVLQIIIPKQIVLRKERKIGIQFYIKKHFPQNGIFTGMVSSGNVQISSPELTALDVVSYMYACGGFNNVCLVVKELIEKMAIKRIILCSKECHVMSTIQRLGYILEKLKAPDDWIFKLKKFVGRRRPSMVNLVSSLPKSSKVDLDWMIVENATVEVE